jgi:small multidrug resistance pump
MTIWLNFGRLTINPRGARKNAMEKSTIGILVTLGLCLLGVIGDYLLKLASDQPQPLGSGWFVAGLLVYASTAFAWVYALRDLKLATVGLVYSIGTLLLLTFVGVVIFHEPLKWPEIVGIGLALTSITLLARFA